MIKTFTWSSVAHDKCSKQEKAGWKVIGVILANGNGERATIDKFGRVQWWTVDESGVMTPAQNEGAS